MDQKHVEHKRQLVVNCVNITGEPIENASHRSGVEKDHFRLEDHRDEATVHVLGHFEATVSEEEGPNEGETGVGSS